MSRITWRGAALIAVGLGIAVGCTATLGGSSSTGAPPASTAETAGTGSNVTGAEAPATVERGPEIDAARTELLSVLNAGIVARCRRGEATDADAHAACDHAERTLAAATPPAPPPGK